ncbi:MAG TPA: energy transducer TonB [Bacteroidales bacterium]|jgi:protein TonB|nr:TonB family protein [Bacteroidales bacterium]HNY52665.1 energy transducer TonB [Bacteroidales bacterium]HOG56042.1 energy transducer TonB [Bacteroidales bacterium]
MAKEKFRAPAFDDIVFEFRNKEYGAYKLRKKYNRNVLIALLIGTAIISTVIITPYLNAKAAEGRTQITERQVVVEMENLDQPTDNVAPPPPPPPPPQEGVQQAAYVPPVVVDSVKPEEEIQLMTADQASVEIQDQEVVEVIEIIAEEIQEEEVEEAEPFVVVEEMPMFPGGNDELMKYLSDHTIYPEVAKENNIQGKVIVRFCVTPKGGVDRVEILKPVDPELDKEAIRVVKTLPAFKPGKQGGKPVPVWFMVPINFTLK